jgi:hypothetical protein
MHQLDFRYGCSMKVRCECGKEYDVHEQLIGKTVRCQQCSRSFVVAAAPSPSQQTIVQVGATMGQGRAAAVPTAPPVAAARTPRPSGPSAVPTVPTVPILSADQKDRDEREKQLIAQYVRYMPKPGSRLRGAQLAKAMASAERRERLGGALRLIGLGIALVVAAVVGFFKLRQMEAGDPRSGEVHWIMTGLNTVGGKWAAAIGLGVIAIACIIYGVLYWRGIFFGRRKR